MSNIHEYHHLFSHSTPWSYSILYIYSDASSQKYVVSKDVSLASIDKAHKKDPPNLS